MKGLVHSGPQEAVVPAAADGEAFTVLDLFSAAAGGWSLGMHRAGFRTVAACEWIDWRRTLYAENNPGVLIYEDVRDVTAERVVADLGAFPDIVVGSPPCQDISSANTKGKGVEGERSGLYFEAVRIIGEGRPRWFALENSANLRTRGADAVLGALEGHDYACWAIVVGGDDIGANHERKRAWIIGCDVEQLAYAPEIGRLARAGTHQDHDAGVDWRLAGHDADDGALGNADREPGAARLNASASQGQGDGSGGSLRPDPEPRRDGASSPADTNGFGRDEGRSGRRGGLDLPVQEDTLDASRIGHEGGRTRRHGPNGDGSASAPSGAGDAPHADQAGQAGQADGSLVTGLRQAEIADDGCGSGRRPDGSVARQVGLRAPDRGDLDGRGAHWSLANLAGHVWLDARLQAWSFLAILLEEGGMRWAGQRLIAATKSAAHVERPSLDSDLARALKTVLAFYSQSTARRLAPIAETLSDACNITLVQGASWEKPAKSAKARSSRSTTSTKTGPTTPPKTSRPSASPATVATICELDLWAVHRRAERRLKLFASRQVEAFGDSVLPQIPEAIGRAILRVEAAYAAITQQRLAA